MDNWSIGKSAILTDLAMCINRYRLHSVGLYACIKVGVKIEDQILYPDLIVTINSGKRKQSTPDYENDYFEGPPNFILEVHPDVESDSAGQRKALFSSAGVEEYLIINEDLTQIEWNRLNGNQFVNMEPDANGIFQSVCLPGLWVPLIALRQRNFWAIMAAIDQGVTRKDHHDLMQSIWNKD